MLQPAVTSEETDERALPDLRRLFAEHGRAVREMVVRLGGPRSDAEDLTQEVFLVAVKRPELFASGVPERALLHGIAVKVVAGARRRAKFRRFFGLDDAPEPSDGRTPATAFESAEDSELVYRLLDRLSEKKRMVLILFEIQGLSGEEIAQAVGCPLKTVWTRLFHARAEFKSLLLEERGPAER